jgi:hypothetical protein
LDLHWIPSVVSIHYLLMTRTELEQRLRAFFEADSHGAKAVYLFGSVARGEATAESDVDLGVLRGSGPARTLAELPLDLQAELEELVGRPVDVVLLDGAPPDLSHRVLRDGRLIWENDRSARIRFEVSARNEYFDLEPMLKRYRRMDRRVP